MSRMSTPWHGGARNGHSNDARVTTMVRNTESKMLIDCAFLAVFVLVTVSIAVVAIGDDMEQISEAVTAYLTMGG